MGALIEQCLLGTFLHGFFENDADDEGLGPDHWFWDPARSGGIFIEHGVHFFDLFGGWLGPGRVVGAQRTKRPDSGFEEQVQCTVRYGETGLVSFYHGFHQAGRMERQLLRLVFERGQITLHEWIPTRMDLTGLVDEEATRRIAQIFPDARLDAAAVYPPGQRACRARHRELDVYQKVEVHAGLGDRKMIRYGQLLRALLADQVAWIRDRSHLRRVTEVNGRESLALAVEATRLAGAETG